MNSFFLQTFEHSLCTQHCFPCWREVANKTRQNIFLEASYKPVNTTFSNDSVPSSAMKKVKWGTVIASVSGLLSTWGSGKACGNDGRSQLCKDLETVASRRHSACKGPEGDFAWCVSGNRALIHTKNFLHADISIPH